MIRKLLVANRGEIACRVMATCRKLGIRTVAVYSDADADALHVKTADEAVRIGPPEAANSYLKAEAVVAAAVATGADAIHPGYGFLSERVVLPQLCAKHNITWVGPHVDAIERMGSKIESKRIAEKADVQGVPGYHGDKQDDASLVAAAKKIGYPILIKASAGGGGRGMRQAANETELLAGLAIARKEAQAGFGDPSLLMEKLIQRPRHLEVQLLGDKHGGLVHLFERECSVQRNFQKVVEEAPAPRLTEKTRKALFDAALKLGKAIKYDSLGTVEFILEEGDEQPYFLEMNTRLQVEHPVTELVTGLDLVELQIRVAAGEKLPVQQDKLAVKGSAIEVRLNAENPAESYRPNIGTISALHLPTGAGVRVDTGITAGSVVTPYYDSMIAKVIAYGADRPTAAQKLSSALRDFALFGVGTNQEFLRDIIEHPQFLKGELTTRFISEVFASGWTSKAGSALEPIAAAAVWAMSVEHRPAPAHLGPFVSLGGFRVLERAGRAARNLLIVEGAGSKLTLDLKGGDGLYEVVTEDKAHAVQATRRGEAMLVTIDGTQATYAISVVGDQVGLATQGHTVTFRVTPELERSGGGAQEAQGGGNKVIAPMPGLINAVEVKVGQQVQQGETVVVMEAMKLMNRLPAPISGRIAEIHCKPGETVSVGAVLVQIEPAEAA